MKNRLLLFDWAEGGSRPSPTAAKSPETGRRLVPEILNSKSPAAPQPGFLSCESGRQIGLGQFMVYRATIRFRIV